MILIVGLAECIVEKEQRARLS